jgi:CarD family transcriptional regulator
MKFSVGDKVVHPIHGPGQITGLKRLDLVEGFERYYVFEVSDRGLKVHVPVRTAKELGLRPVMSPVRLGQVLDTLRAKPRTLSEDYRVRQARARERLEAGAPLRIAEIVRDLTWHERRAHLTKADSDLLTRGRDLLAAEIALVTDAEFSDARQKIDAALTATATGPGVEGIQ